MEHIESGILIADSCRQQELAGTSAESGVSDNINMTLIGVHSCAGHVYTSSARRRDERGEGTWKEEWGRGALI